MEEIQVEDNLRYRSKVLCSDTMTVVLNQGKPAGFKSDYKRNANMAVSTGRGAIYPFFEYTPEYSRVHWNESVLSVSFGSINVMPNEFAMFDRDLPKSEKLIWKLFPDESVFFYDSGKLSDDEYGRVRRNHTFGYSSDDTIRINPYSAAAPFKAELFFCKLGKFSTMGVESIFKRLSEIQDNFFYYIDVLLEPVLGNIADFENNTLAKYMNFVSNLFTLDIKKVTCDDKMFNRFANSILQSTVVMYYGSRHGTVQDKLNYAEAVKKGSEEKDALKRLLVREERAKNYTLYYFEKSVEGKSYHDFDPRWIAQKIAEKVLPNPETGEIDANEVKLVEVATHILFIVHRLNYGLVEELKALFAKNFDENTFISDGETLTINPRSAYEKARYIADQAIRDAKSVFTTALQIDRTLQLGNGYRTHKIAKLQRRPSKGTLMSIIRTDQPLTNEMYMGECVLGYEAREDVYRRTQHNDINGKSIIFRVYGTPNILIFLLNAKGLTYTTDSCRIIFEHVLVTIGGKTIRFSDDENDVPYYICHYIHSSKDDKSDTYSAIRLEFGPELNVPYANYHLLDDSGSAVALRNYFDMQFNNLCSSIIYVPAKFFNPYAIQQCAIKKGSDRKLTASVLDGDFVMQPTADLGIKVASVTSAKGPGYESKLIEATSISEDRIMTDNEFDEMFADFPTVENDNVIVEVKEKEMEVPMTMTKSTASKVDTKPKKNRINAISICESDIVDAANAGSIMANLLIDPEKFDKYRTERAKKELAKKVKSIRKEKKDQD